MTEPECRAVSIASILPQALENTLSPLGQGPKTAVLFTLEQKYGLSMKNHVLTTDSLAKAILDLFGQDGGRLLLEKLWISLEELAQSNINNASVSCSPDTSDKKMSPDEQFNSQVSSIFIDFISDTLGQDVYMWVEAKLREQNISLKNSYFDADRISPVLWTSFSSAADFLLNNLIRNLSSSLNVEPVNYTKDSKLQAILDDIKNRAKY